MSQSAFLVRMSNEGYYETAMARGLVVIGWADLEELKNCDAPTKSERIVKIKDVLRNSNWYNSERAVGAVAGSLHRFIYEIRNGDYILCPRHKGFHIGVVDAPDYEKATYLDELRGKDCAWNWKVNWKKKDDGSILFIQRSFLDARLASTMHYRGTCLKFDDYSIEDIKKAIDRKSPPTIAETLLSDDIHIKNVVSVLQKVLTSDRLENLIKKLLEFEGAHVVRCPTGKRGSAGDVDIVATFDIGYCGTARDSDEVIYGYQVKCHVGQSDAEAVQQLVDRFEDDNDPIIYAKGIAISTGEFDQSAINMKDKFNLDIEKHGQEIVLLNGSDIAKWIINLGLGQLNEIEDLIDETQ